MPTRRFTPQILLVALLTFCLSAPAAAQNPGYVTNNNDTGRPEYGSFMTSQIDRVNLSNGGLSIRMPLISRKGRGFDYSYGYRYESKYWVVERYTIEEPGQQAQVRFQWYPDQDNALWQTTTNLGGFLDWVEQIYECAVTPSPYDQISIVIRSNFTFTTGDRTKYEFPVRKKYPYVGNMNDCLDDFAIAPFVHVGHSNTGHLELDISNDATLLDLKHKIRFKNGSKWEGMAFSHKDSNGNWCCGSDGTGWALDTLGRQVYKTRVIEYFPGGWPPRLIGIDYYDSDGQIRTITVEQMQIALSTNFPTAGTTTCGFDQFSGWNTTVLKRITLPNNPSYTFSYEEWWNTSNPTQQNPYGEVTKITLPTGGYIKYKWATLAQWDKGPKPAPPSWSCAPKLDARVVVERRVSEDGLSEQVWTYSYATHVTTVTDPLGNISVHTFTDSDGRLIEVSVEYRNSSGTPLRRVNMDWAGDPGPTTAGQPPADGTNMSFWSKPRNPRVIRTTTTLLDSNQVSKTETDYGDCYSYSAYGYNWTDCRENPTLVREYDYGSGAAGPLVRYATFTYLHSSNTNYSNAHIWDRVTEKKIFDAGGVLKAHGQFSYDSTAVTATSGVPQHDYSNYSSSNTIRGNQTESRRWRNTDDAWLTTTNYFNDVGNLIQTTDPGAHPTTFSYADNYTDGVNRNSQGYVTQVTYPTTGGVAHLEKKQYYWYTGLVAAACGQNFSGACTNTFTPPQPDYTKFTYDSLGRPLTAVMADGGQNTFAYNEASLPITVSATTKITATSNLVSTAVIDGLGRVKQTQLNSNPGCAIKVDTTYDSVGRKSTMNNPYCLTSDPTYGITKFKYDALGRTTRVIPPDGNEVADTNVAKSDYSGNTVTVTDQAGKKRKSESDALGRLTRVWEPDINQSLVHVTHYQYDVLDNLLCVHQKSTDATTDKACDDATVPATWRPRTFMYNSLSQLLSATNPESGTISYAYDSDGNLLTKTDARGISTTYSYDALHRATGKTYSNGDPAASFIYDVSSVDGLSIQYSVGRLVKSAQGSTRTVSSFDVGGRVLTQWQCTPLNCGSGWFTLTYAYNLIGGHTGYTDGVGNTYTQSFNTAGQVTQVTSSLNDAQHPGTLASAITYNAAGAVAQMTYGNGLVGTVSYNNRLQPTQMATGSVFTLNYGFVDASGNNNGNVMAWSATGAQAFSRSYTYDEVNRLKTMAAPGDVCSGLSWSYDIWGNRTQQNVTGGSCGQSQLSINTLNRIADTGYTYDAAGNMTAEPGKTYQYDAENRLISINSGAVATYVYDAAGRRVRKIAGGTTTEYIYGPDGVVAEKVGTTWTVGYVYLNGQLLAQYKNGTTYFAHPDHLGSTRVLTTVSATVYESYDYLPYGESNSCTGASATAKCFTGKERDAESGLDYFGARYYVSLAGRFLTTDLPFIDQHLGNPQSWNLYAYARNNPLGFVDPTGHAPEDPNRTRQMEAGDGPTGAGISDTSWSIWDNVPVGGGVIYLNALLPQYPSAEDRAAGNFISVTSRPTEDRRIGHIPSHFRIGIPIVEDGKWTGAYLHYEVLGDEGTTKNQQVRLNDPRKISGKFLGRLVAVTPEQKKALVDRLNYFVKNPGTCPVCGPKYALRTNNSNTFVYNMLSQNPAGRIAPPRPLYSISPGYKERKGNWYE